MTQFREIPRESDMRRLLAQGRVDMSPLTLVPVKREPTHKTQQKTPQADAMIELGWGKKAFRFAVECRAVSTPKEIAAAAETAKRNSRPPRSFPMVFVPYLAESQLRFLQEQQVSGIDLSGNALIMVPGKILVSRTGAPNNFRRAGSSRTYTVRIVRSSPGSSFSSRSTIPSQRSWTKSRVAGDASRRPPSPKCAAVSTRTS